MPEVALTAVPLTSYPGEQGTPTFSPDGNQVAFCWDGEKQDNVDIYVKLVGAGPPLRLTTNTAEDCQPAWSPDGRSIAFLRKLPGGRAAVMQVSPLVGAERKLAESSDFFSKPAWSPDGKWLVIADKSAATEPDSLFLLSMENGEKRRLTTLPGRLGGDSNAAFSPDGHTLAFVRSPSKMFEGISYQGDVYLLRLSDGFMPKGEPKRATFDNRYTSRPAWTADGREILFSAGSFMGGGLWRMTADGSSKPQRMASLGEALHAPAVSRQGNRLAYMRESFDFNIWRMRVPEPVDRASPAGPKGTPFIASTRLEFSPRFSPDGKRIAFVSGRSSQAGGSEIWLCDSDGSNQQQVTSLGADAANPSWSPDGESIAFDSTAEGSQSVYVIRTNGGKRRRVTPDARDNNAPTSLPNWSRDGKWIYFTSNRSGKDQVWKVPADGGRAVQVTKNGGLSGLESTDGKFLYYAKGSDPKSIWKVPVDGGQETQIIQSLVSAVDFAVVDRGIYFIPAQSARSNLSSSIQFFSFETAKIMPIATTEKRAAYGLTISPDGRWILYTQHDQSPASELMLVENFQ
jgi:Tol biopolymer transport system component